VKPLGGKVNISGGIVSATIGKAIYLGASGAATTISDSVIVFAYGTAVVRIQTETGEVVRKILKEWDSSS